MNLLACKIKIVGALNPVAGFPEESGKFEKFEKSGKFENFGLSEKSRNFATWPRMNEKKKKT